MDMSRLLLIGISLLAFAGCVSTKNVPLKAGALSTREGGTLVLSSREKPTFSASTAGKAAFGMIGVLAEISAGNQLVRDNNIADPAEYIGTQLMADLAALNNLKIASRSSVVASNTADTAGLANLYAGADVLLDVQTMSWNFIYFPTDWNSYRVNYSARARIIETRDRKLVAEAFCSRIPEKTPDAPSYEQLTANGAAGLKAELMKSAQHCLDEFRNTLLGLGDTRTADRR
jgi:hypothetical protein